MNGLQSGDPAKLAGALVQLASQDEPPLRFAAGARHGGQLMIAPGELGHGLSNALTLCSNYGGQHEHPGIGCDPPDPGKHHLQA